MDSIGTYQIPIHLLQEPPPVLMIREMKPWYVEYLVEMMGSSEGDHEDLTSPLLVTASVKKEDFRISQKDKYSYQVYAYVRLLGFIYVKGIASSEHVPFWPCSICYVGKGCYLQLLA